MKIAIFGNKRQKREQIEYILEILERKNIDTYMQSKFFHYLKTDLGLDFNISGLIKGNEFCADFAISIGGDGTFLRTASAIENKDIPILGINTGRLGFLADVTWDDLEDTLTDMEEGKYRIENRSRLHLVDDDKVCQGFNYALNEIAILKQDTASMITVHAYINDEFLSTYEADGLIIATPTGSTAYSLSVGGPIMSPTASSFILTAVAPHSLNARPLVVDDTCELKFEIESRNNNFLISLDGRSEVFPADTKLTIRKAEFPLKVVKRLGHTFYGTLRDKLKWGTDPRR